MMHSKYKFSFTIKILNIIGKSIALTVLLSYLPVAQAQNTTCTIRGGGTQVSIEYINGGCRTLLLEGGQSKQIAWAQSHPQLCTDIAERVMAKSGRSAWNCDAALASTKSHWPSAQHKKSAQYSGNGDYAILKSSER